MVISVRMARPDDSEAARRVGDEAFATVRWAYRPIPAARAGLAAAAPALERLVAEVGGRVVGTARFGVRDGSLHVVGLGVLPGFRRRGVARALVAELSRLAGEKGCRALSLYTVTRTGNVSVFARLGFHVVREQLDAYSVSADGEPLTEAYMERAT